MVMIEWGQPSRRKSAAPAIGRDGGVVSNVWWGLQRQGTDEVQTLEFLSSCPPTIMRQASWLRNPSSSPYLTTLRYATPRHTTPPHCTTSLHQQQHLR